MKTSFVSTMGLYDAMRSSVAKLQTQLAAAQKEATSSRPADVGMTLGYQTGAAVTLREEVSRLQTIQDSNALVGTRLQTAQNAIGAINEDRQSFAKTMITALGASVDQSAIANTAKMSLNAMVSALNTSVGNDYVFSGVNTDTVPINNFGPNTTNSGSASTTVTPYAQLDAVFQDFVTSKGGDAGALSAADMNEFMDGAYAQQFEGANWASWSNLYNAAEEKSVDETSYRISTSQKIAIPVNADDGAFRATAKSYALLSYLGSKGVTLGAEAFKAVAHNALNTASNVSTSAPPSAGLNNNMSLTALQSRLGGYQQAVTNATDRMQIQSNLMSSQLNNLEYADPYSAATKVNTLITQLNTAYSLTAQIQKLSILNYIS
jgi:flagellar hook-associated protein 3 FlgL